MLLIDQLAYTLYADTNPAWTYGGSSGWDVETTPHPGYRNLEECVHLHRARLYRSIAIIVGYPHDDVA